MPLYMDIHELAGKTAGDVAGAHRADLETQQKYGVEYHKYWVNERCGRAFCLVEAPSAEAAARVHREAHGLVAGKIIEVQPELAEVFLGGGETNAEGAVLVPGNGSTLDPAIRTVLFTDIVDSTSLTQRLGDDTALALLHLHDAVVRKALAATQGREVKHTGDGILATFFSAAGAVRCAMQIQQELAQAGRDDLKVRIGAAAGEPVGHAEDIFGSTVQLAARLCAQAAPDQILVSNVVAELCVGKKLNFRPLGGLRLKGFEQPVNVHLVEWTAMRRPVTAR
ncbi:MAG TPA: nickel-binding protein [Chthoniobacterales bacterium]|jgi:class 3 adenylate cyclase|nr:nickel-binding protein [Chthoniobacterales bacterium]